MISICVPIYNTIDYLKRCLESLINQTYRDLEIILVDDGSTDGSALVCDEYAQRDCRIKVIHKANGGEASARNAGLRAATGEYIAFSDSDDEYALDAFEIMMKEIQKYGADIAVGGYLEVGKKTHFAIPSAKTYLAKDVANAFLSDKSSYGDRYIFSTVNGKVFNLNIINSNSIVFDEQFVIGNDSIFMCEYLKHIKSVVNTFTPVYTYYKYDLNERVQGMSWEYPDAFLLDMIVNNKLANIMGGDNEHQIVICYMNLIKDLIGLVSYETPLGIRIENYIDFCKRNIAYFEKGAVLEFEKDAIRDKFKNDIPYKMISYIIANAEDNKLGEIFRLINRVNNSTLDKSYKYTRLMIKL